MRFLEVLGSSTGGVVRHVVSLTEGLRADGDVVVVAGPAATLGAAGLHGERVEISDRPHPLADARAVLRLRRLAGDADAVHAHGLRAGALAVVAVRTRRHRPRIVVTLHNLPVGGLAIRRVSAVLERVVARGADAVLTVSSDLGERAGRLGASRVERALVPSPQRSVTIGTDQARAVRQGLGVEAGTTLLVMAARLAPQKDVPLFAGAVFALSRSTPELPGPVLAVVAGDGPLRAVLEADARERDIPVRYLGDRDDVPLLFAAADIVVITSRWEGQPLAAQEALRVGAALVATDVGGTRELVEDGAVLIPYDATTPDANIDQLVHAVTRLLTCPDELDDLRRRAAQRATELPVEVDAANQIHQLFVALHASGPASQ